MYTLSDPYSKPLGISGAQCAVREAQLEVCLQQHGGPLQVGGQRVGRLALHRGHQPAKIPRAPRRRHRLCGQCQRRRAVQIRGGQGGVLRRGEPMLIVRRYQQQIKQPMIFGILTSNFFPFFGGIFIVFFMPSQVCFSLLEI